MPFSSASIGKAYRNETSPRTGLLRGREFLMAEVEHSVDPEGGKRHEKFDEVAHIELSLLDRHTQLSGKTDLQVISRQFESSGQRDTRLLSCKNLPIFPEDWH
jgi:glycyl-tRNA synthetase